VEAGGALSALAKALPVVELRENRRQRETWEKEALSQLRSGSARLALSVYEGPGRLHLAETAEDAREAMADAWWASHRSGEEAIMYALRRADVDDLNARARVRMGAAGLLGEESVEVSGRAFAKGDRVMALRNDRPLGVRNGTLSTVASVGRVFGGLTLEDGTHLPAEYLRAGHLAHGYATTVHKGQGATVDRAFLLGSDQLYREAGYVGLSRGSLSNELLVVTEGADDAVDELAGRLQKSRAQALALGQFLLSPPAKRPFSPTRRPGPYQPSASRRLLDASATVGPSERPSSPGTVPRTASMTLATLWGHRLPTSTTVVLGGPPASWCTAKGARCEPPGPPPSRPRPGRARDLPEHGRAGLYLGWGEKDPVLARSDEHLLVLGPPRSGKTTCVLSFSLLAHPDPAVVTSTKPDVFSLTAWARARLGKVWLSCPGGNLEVPEGAEELCWSPLVGCEAWDEAVARAHALSTAARPNPTAHDAHWVERGQALLAPLLHAAALGNGDMAVVLSWLHRRDLRVPLSLLDEMTSRSAADVLVGIAQPEAREQSGIFSTADSLLAAYRSNAALQAARFSNFSPADFAQSKDTVYICAPGTAQALYAPLVVALLDQVRRAVYGAPSPRRRCCSPWRAGSRAPLPDLAATVAEGGSQGLLVLACLQDLSQARYRWGTQADGFLTLFTHKLVLPGIADTTTLRAISDLAGEVSVRIRSTSVHHGLLRRPASTTWSTRRQLRLPVDAIARGTPGAGLLVSGTSMVRVWLPALPRNFASALTGNLCAPNRCSTRL
jgi:hypothetical protein